MDEKDWEAMQILYEEKILAGPQNVYTSHSRL